MKTSTPILALIGLFTVAFGVAIPGDDTVANVQDTSENVNIMRTNCGDCSQIYMDCTSHCLISDCSPECLKKACNSVVKGFYCGKLCGWKGCPKK